MDEILTDMLKPAHLFIIIFLHINCFKYAGLFLFSFVYSFIIY